MTAEAHRFQPIPFGLGVILGSVVFRLWGWAGWAVMLAIVIALWVIGAVLRHRYPDEVGS